MSILKIEAFSGLSGDMFLGALAELTDAYAELEMLPSKLHLTNVEVKITDMNKAGIACRHVKIIDNNVYKSSSHVHHHPGHRQGGELANVQLRHEHHGHHRHLRDIEKLIDQGDIPSGAKNSAKRIFRLLGEAEAKVHGVDINTLHFHEVGAIDSIMDIVGTAYLLDKVKISQVVSAEVCTGHGFVMTEHGRMPIPAPATKELLLGIPTYAGKEAGEMTTPTGAAILKFLNPSFSIPPLVELKTAHGPGEKNFPHPNVLRLTLCESAESNSEEIMMVETNIDDMSSQLLGSDFQEQLLSAGALDFYYTQVIMKKGRPGLLISVFVPPANVKQVSDFLLENTTSIGVRTYPVARHILKRTIKSVNTSVGDIQVKEVETPSGKRRETPEFESVKAIAALSGKSVLELMDIVKKELNDRSDLP
ncbi:MAG: nickel pincer cofactor biosynthesis protein LarC [Cyclobacteriaceae bacterium]|nr:nickel pincer cofactor biosynthesis protein LarC [Cyclobacteriaceae bacterium]